MFEIDIGRFPTTEEGILALIEEPSGVTGWSGSYLKSREVPADPFVGFLPPNDEDGRGEGSVKYTIEPHPGGATGGDTTAWSSGQVHGPE